MSCEYCHESCPKNRTDEFCSDLCKERMNQISKPTTSEIAKLALKSIRFEDDDYDETHREQAILNVTKALESCANKAYAEGVIAGQRQLANTIDMVQKSMFRNQK